MTGPCAYRVACNELLRLSDADASEFAVCIVALYLAFAAVMVGVPIAAIVLHWTNPDDDISTYFLIAAGVEVAGVALWLRGEDADA